MRTTVVVLWAEAQAFPDPIQLRARLFDAKGDEVANWDLPVVPGKPIFVDSAAEGPWRIHDGCDGLLALYACTLDVPSQQAIERFNRLFPIVDWRRGDGQVVTLHSDNALRRSRTRVQRITEIVVTESDVEHNALVFLNGEAFQPEDSLEVSVRDRKGRLRKATYAPVMQPFTVHRIPLRSLFPELVEFCGGQALQVSATFASVGLFSRPYVETTGVRWGAYHAGNVYQWIARPYYMHALVAGEVNPAAVIHDERTRTFVNLMHSQEGCEDDLNVSVRLFDTHGACVADRASWLSLPRHGLVRFDVAELLPNPAIPFRGHIALGFSPEPGQAVPCHLQALLEYQRPDSVARTMTWSDEWNSRVGLARQDRRPSPLVRSSYFRIWEDDQQTTEIAITNPGHRDYDRVAKVRVRLHGHEGWLGETHFDLAPYATHMGTVEQLFPGVREALQASGLAIVVVESTSDLANIAFSHHRETGAIAAEHFMAMAAEYDGRIEWPSGS